jgi:hypothetical protein
MRVPLCLVIASVAALSAAGRQATQPIARDTVAPKGSTAIIRGRVVAADTGAPLPRANVTLSGRTASVDGAQTSATVPVVSTDDQGRYEFRQVPAGPVTLRATKTGYVTLAHGQRRAVEIARPLVVAAGQTLEGVDFALPRGSVIAVKALDANGESMTGVTVTVYRLGVVGGARRLVSVVSTGNPALLTSSPSAPEQRIFGLAPGDYYVSAGPLNADNTIAADQGRSYVTTFYPGTALEQDAQRVTVGLGQEVAVTVEMIPMKLARIGGTLRTSDGKPITRVTARLESARPNLTSGLSVGTRPDGTFGANNVPPGDYVLMIVPAATGGDTDEVARVPITIAERDLMNLAIVTGKGATVRGRFRFDTGEPPVDLRPGTVQASVAFPTGAVASAGARSSNPDWTFELRGLLGAGGIISTLPGSPRWYPKAVMVGGRDMIDTPIDFEVGQEFNGVEIVLTQKQAELTGGVTDDKATPVIDYVAVIFPEDRRLWTAHSRFIAADRSDQTGQFHLQGLPAGRYLAAAIDYLEPGEERDPALLNRLSDRAVFVALGEGETKRINLRMTTY